MTDQSCPRLAEILGPLDGAELPGGCDQCDAYQSVAVRAGVWHVTVSHDADCPFWFSVERCACDHGRGEHARGGRAFCVADGCRCLTYRRPR